MDIFASVARDSRIHLKDAVLLAAYQLGVFVALGSALSSDRFAQVLGVAPRRLRALLDVLVLDGVLIRMQEAGEVRFARAASLPPPPATLPRAGWGLLAEVIRQDRPLLAAEASVGSEDACARFHQHLGQVGQAPARELAARLAVAFRQGGVLLDAGAGIGTYAAAVLQAAPLAHATVVDDRSVMELAREYLREYGDRVRYVTGDLLDVSLPRQHQVALLCNVLHLHPPAMCARLIARAAAAVVPGGQVIVKDLFLTEDRAGPEVGLLFALNMALFTREGDVHDAEQIRTWLRQAELVDVRIEHLTSAPESVLIAGRVSGRGGS